MSQAESNDDNDNDDTDDEEKAPLGRSRKDVKSWMLVKILEVLCPEVWEKILSCKLHPASPGLSDLGCEPVAEEYALFWAKVRGRVRDFCPKNGRGGRGGGDDGDRCCQIWRMKISETCCKFIAFFSYFFSKTHHI